MAGATIVSSRSGKKPLDAQFNLVPFIDLLSCCISFLLITAVWTQVASMKVAGRGGACTACEDPKPAAKLPSLTLSRDGYSFVSSSGETIDMPKQAATYDQVRLADVLRRQHASSADPSALEVRAEDAIRYEDLVRAMDVAKAAGFGEVSVQPI